MKADKKSVQKVIALIEFKAHAIARPEPAYYGLEFQNDVKKMRPRRFSLEKRSGISSMFLLYWLGPWNKAKKRGTCSSVSLVSRFHRLRHHIKASRIKWTYMRRHLSQRYKKCGTKLRTNSDVASPLSLRQYKQQSGQALLPPLKLRQTFPTAIPSLLIVSIR